MFSSFSQQASNISVWHAKRVHSYRFWSTESKFGVEISKKCMEVVKNNAFFKKCPISTRGTFFFSFRNRLMWARLFRVFKALDHHNRSRNLEEINFVQKVHFFPL